MRRAAILHKNWKTTTKADEVRFLVEQSGMAD